MHKENFLYFIRVKPGVLGSHQKSETRTKIHHQRKLKTLPKNAQQKHHVQT